MISVHGYLGSNLIHTLTSRLKLSSNNCGTGGEQRAAKRNPYTHTNRKGGSNGEERGRGRQNTDTEEGGIEKEEGGGEEEAEEEEEGELIN